MPIYEEKLISPFAVRFTQEHIRSTFRDGRELQLALAQIEVHEGVGEYDVVLHAPFPTIEVIRYEPSERRMGADCCEEVESGVDTGAHWFTFDNRRLYCLQHAAAAQWPKKVAAVVEVLYADPGTLRKKFDSTTLGRSVNLDDHSSLSRWDWRESVAGPHCSTEHDADAMALSAVATDDAKETVDALQGKQNDISAAMRFLASEHASLAAHNSVCKVDEPPSFSTTSTTIELADECSETVEKASEPSNVSSDVADLESTAWATGDKLLSGVWKSKGETYTITFDDAGFGTCVRQGFGAARRFTVVLDEGADVAWWGLEHKFGVDLSQLRARPRAAHWYSGHTFCQATGSRKAKWVWSKTEEANDDGAQAVTATVSAKAKASKSRNAERGEWNEWSDWSDWKPSWNRQGWEAKEQAPRAMNSRGADGGSKSANRRSKNGEMRWVATAAACGA